MSITDTHILSADVLADMQALADAASAGRRPDAEVTRRVDERFEEVYKQLLETWGVREIAVDLIRETRDER